MKYFNKFETESKRLLIKPMQTLAFGFICHDEEIVWGVRKTHIQTSVLWRQGVSIQALLQMGKYQILTHPFLRRIWLSGLRVGFVWAETLSTGSSSSRAAASSCGRAVVGAGLYISPRGAGGPAQVDVKVVPAPSSPLQKACEQLLLSSLRQT